VERKEGVGGAEAPLSPPKGWGGLASFKLKQCKWYSKKIELL